MKRLKTCILVCLILGLQSGARGQWSTDPAVNTPVCTQPENQKNPTIVSDGSGGAIIVWEDYRNEVTTGCDLYAQRVDSAGYLVWQAAGVAVCDTSGDQRQFTVISDGVGGAVIVWQDFRNQSSWGIFAQRLNAEGQLLWNRQGVAVCAAASDQVAPTITVDDMGGAIIVWQDHRNAGSTGYDIYAQRLNAQGEIQWLENGILICNWEYDQNTPTCVSDGRGGAIIVWQDYRSGGFVDLYAQRVTAQGTALWARNGVVVCQAAFDQLNPTLVGDGAGGGFVIWEDFRNQNWDIYGQRINANGNPLWTTNGVAICQATLSQNHATVSEDGNGGWYITWEDNRAGYDIYGQRITATGTLAWPENGIAICDTSGEQRWPRMISDDAGGAIITWRDGRSGQYDIYAQRIAANGFRTWSYLGSYNGIPVCNHESDQYFPALVADGKSGAVVVWHDARNSQTSGWDIYAHHLEAEPRPLEITEVPLANAIQVPVTTVISVTFNQPLKAATITNQTFLVNGTQTGLCSGSFSFNEDRTQVRFAPHKAFSVGEKVTVTLTRNIQSAAGARLKNGFSFSFYTEATAGSGTFTNVAGSPLPTGTNPGPVLTADFNNDNLLDVLAISALDTVVLFSGNGDGTFQHPQVIVRGPRVNACAAGDFNVDGNLDVAISSSLDSLTTGNILILLGKGNGTFQNPGAFAVGRGSNSVEVADFNADGFLDLVAGNYGDNSLSVLLGKGDGSFQGQRTIAIPGSPRALVVGDFNNDGRMDIVATSGRGIPTNPAYSPGQATVLSGNGDGTFQSVGTFATNPAPADVALGDFNEDGHLDLVVTNEARAIGSDWSVSLLPGRGDGTFGQPQSFKANARPVAVAVGDVNNDGHPDLTVAAFNVDSLAVLSGDGSGRFGPPRSFKTGQGPVSVALGDVNADGSLDALVTNRTSGNLSILGNMLRVDILVVGQDRSQNVSNLRSAGYTVVYYYEVSALNTLDLSTFEQVWYSDGYPGRIPGSLGRSKLKNFIQSGGRLFIEGDAFDQSATLAVWRDSLFNELGAGGIRQSRANDLYFKTSWYFYTNSLHPTSSVPFKVDSIEHRWGGNGSFETTGNGTTIVGTIRGGGGEPLALAFDYGDLTKAPNSRAVIYLNSNNSAYWNRYAANLAHFLSYKEQRATLSVVNSRGVPGAKSKVWINLENHQNVAGVELTVTDVPNLLQVDAIQPSGRAAGFTVNFNEDPSGALRAVLYSSTGASLPPGAGSILEITYNVSNQAKLGDRAKLLVSKVLLTNPARQPIAVKTIDGTFTFSIRKGDVNFDGIVNMTDVLMAVDIVIQRGNPPTPMQLLAADYNSDGVVNIMDVLGIIYEILGIIPGGSLAKSGTLAEIILPPQLELTAGENFDYPLTIACAEEIAAAQFKLKYDPRWLVVGEPVIASQASNMNLVSHNHQGSLTILMYSLEGKTIASGNNTLFTLPVKIKPGAPKHATILVEKAVLVGSDARMIPTEIVIQKPGTSRPQTFALSQNYPNPCNPETIIKYQLPRTTRVVLKIYNLLGQEMRTLVDESKEAGFYTVHWDGKDDRGIPVASGIYLYRIQAGDFVSTKKLAVLK